MTHLAHVGGVYRTKRRRKVWTARQRLGERRRQLDLIANSSDVAKEGKVAHFQKAAAVTPNSFATPWKLQRGECLMMNCCRARVDMKVQ